MTTELYYLTAAAVLTAILWVPYILDVILRNPIGDAVGYGELNRSAWGERMRRAHYNAVENLAPFAAVVLVANAAGISDAATTMSAAVFFWARGVHAISYTFAIPWIRTLSFVAAWGAILCFAWQIVAAG